MTVLDKPTAPKPPDQGPVAGRAFNPVPALTVLAVLAAVAALLFGARWALALGDADFELAAERDAVIVDARQAAINLNSLDHANVPAGLDLWEQTSTGTLLDDFRAHRGDYEQVVTESKRVTDAMATDAAVAELDARAGIARVLVGVNVNVREEGADPVVTRIRMQLEMTRTEQGWKASRAAPVRGPQS